MFIVKKKKLIGAENCNCPTNFFFFVSFYLFSPFKVYICHTFDIQCVHIFWVKYLMLTIWFNSVCVRCFRYFFSSFGFCGKWKFCVAKQQKGFKFHKVKEIKWKGNSHSQCCSAVVWWFLMFFIMADNDNNNTNVCNQVT